MFKNFIERGKEAKQEQSLGLTRRYERIDPGFKIEAFQYEGGNGEVDSGPNERLQEK